MKLLVINYHYLADRDFLYEGIYPCSEKKFRNQVETLAKSYTFVSSEDVSAHYEKGIALPNKCCLLSFDDGLKEQYEIAFKILEEWGIPGVFFINTSSFVTTEAQTVHKIHWLRSFVEPKRLLKEIKELAENYGVSSFSNFDLYKPDALKQYRYDTESNAVLKYLLNFVLPYDLCAMIIGSCFQSMHPSPDLFASQIYMDKIQITELAKKSYLGLHSHNHLPLAKLTKQKVLQEIKVCQSTIYSLTGECLNILSYPYGGKSSVSQMVEDVVKHANIKLAFTMNRDVNTSKTNPLRLNRFDTNDLNRALDLGG